MMDTVFFAFLVVDGARGGRIGVEIMHAPPGHREALEVFLRFLRTVPKPPAPVRFTITVAEPRLLGLLLDGKLSLGSLDLVERVVGLEVDCPYDRTRTSAPVMAWVALFRDRLRGRLATVARRRGSNIGRTT